MAISEFLSLAISENNQKYLRIRKVTQKVKNQTSPSCTNHVKFHWLKVLWWKGVANAYHLRVLIKKKYLSCKRKLQCSNIPHAPTSPALPYTCTMFCNYCRILACSI